MASHHEAGRRLSWQQVPSHVRSTVEAATMPHLPAGLPVPRLLDIYDGGCLVGVLFTRNEHR
jgi:hypothetical protein